jgi:hypothetical protein
VTSDTESRYRPFPKTAQNRWSLFLISTNGHLASLLGVKPHNLVNSSVLTFSLLNNSLLAKTVARVLAVRRNFLSAHMFDNLISFLDAARKKVLVHVYFQYRILGGLSSFLIPMALFFRRGLQNFAEHAILSRF